MDNNTHICATTADLEKRLAASQAELSAARAQIASLQRQLTHRIEAVSLTVVCGDDEPTRRHGPAAQPDYRDDPLRRRGPFVIRREPITKVIDVPEVRL